ncbi:histidine kinase [Haloferax mucosum ATCC BAA-1512]|uniref:histidine kinase n=1 Tax=Haloferax mucosum ATCC BAA-1512 TaxID=662479 RepID=M0IKG7_9EURY|nr:HAMP domain-containing sensor histidine kinase [Haloferax mucosum]ELZ96502.1 histidine kinase [Haloferax mucosum ATCC BAA-1512]
MALIYAAFGFLWVATSDWVVAQLPNRLLLQTFKGWFFVAFSAGLVYVLVGRSRSELHRTTEQLESTLTHTSVLHRILRHDIRNACTSILGYAELVEPRSDSPEGVNPTDAIRARANRLVEVSDEVALLRSVELAEGTAVQINLSCAVADAVEDIEMEHDDVSVSVDSPAELVVEAHPALPRSIMELLENAAVHSGDDVTSIAVTVQELPETARVAILDDGPGMPGAEREALASGSETQLNHTSGVGLWLVRAIVDASGGSLTIETGEHSGTAVTISLPRSS